MTFQSSLRAQRGNPDFGAAAGLPRSARNDVVLRAFAPSREPNLFLFSREDAKVRRRRGVYGLGNRSQERAADVPPLLGHNMPPVGA